jgi:ATP synthase protein I
MSDDTGQGLVGGRSLDSSFLRPTRDQLLVLVVTGPIVIGLGGPSALTSWVSGALCAALPQAWFGWRMARAARSSAAVAARQGLAAEGGKFFLSAVSFALVFAIAKPASPGLVFLGFAILWLVQIISAARLALQPQGR